MYVFFNMFMRQIVLFWITAVMTALLEWIFDSISQVPHRSTNSLGRFRGGNN